MTPWSNLGTPGFGPSAAGEHHYALVDGAQIHRLGSLLSAGKRISGHRALFGSTLAKDVADATPHLLALADADSSSHLLLRWGDAVESHGAISVIVSTHDLDSLATRLIARLDARLPDRFDCVNRFYDGRVTPHLHEALHPAQREVFFSVAAQWWVIDHRFRWQSLACRYSSQDQFESPLELDDAQQAALIDACYPYSVIDHFAKTDEELLETVPPSERYGFFSQALKVAAEYGIDGGASAVLFCTLALTRGPRFYLQHDWQRDLQRVKAGELSLQQALKGRHD